MVRDRLRLRPVPVRPRSGPAAAALLGSRRRHDRRPEPAMVWNRTRRAEQCRLCTRSHLPSVVRGTAGAQIDRAGSRWRRDPAALSEGVSSQDFGPLPREWPFFCAPGCYSDAFPPPTGPRRSRHRTALLQADTRRWPATLPEVERSRSARGSLKEAVFRLPSDPAQGFANPAAPGWRVCRSVPSAPSGPSYGSPP